jgi:hypothetical protein
MNLKITIKYICGSIYTKLARKQRPSTLLLVNNMQQMEIHISVKEIGPHGVYEC